MSTNTTTRKNRRTGATVQARNDDFLGWVTVCMTHGAHAEHPSKTHAHNWLAEPWVWCDGCNAVKTTKDAQDAARAAELERLRTAPLQLRRNTGAHPYYVNVNGVTNGSITCYFDQDLNLVSNTIRDNGDKARQLEAQLRAAIAERGLVLPQD